MSRPAQPSAIPGPQAASYEALPPELLAGLESIYRELDDTVSSLGVGCWARGSCCDFERCDHRLYASTVELAYVRAKHPQRFTAESALCPFWKEGRCTERERRPLGCRTYFCDRRYKQELEAVYEMYYARLRALALEHGVAWRYEPFVEALRRPPAAAVGCGPRDAS